MAGDEVFDIAVADQHIEATLVVPATLVPGVLFVHGWGVDRETYLNRAREIAALGCICLLFDMRGHAATVEQRDEVTREDNLEDAVAAYDRLAAHPLVDPAAIAVIGSSYGGYLAAVLTGVRPVRWLGMRVPALYKDEDWLVPKQELRDHGLEAFRQGPVSADENRALGACAAFEGDVLLVKSGQDEVIPDPVIGNYLAALGRVRSLTYRVIPDADHSLSEEPWQQAYASMLLAWANEMVIAAREDGVAPDARIGLAPSLRREPSNPA
jgi:pimeloyl-ACP methyl ester carboxylesterase